MNSVSTTHIIECISNLTNNRAKTGFDKTSLEKMEQLFRKTVGEGKEIKRDDFNKIVHSKNVSHKIVNEIYFIRNFPAIFHRARLSNFRQR